MESCAQMAEEEYVLSPSQRAELKKNLERESNETYSDNIKFLQYFLESSKARKARIKKYFPGDLVKPITLDDINFDAIHHQIAEGIESRVASTP